MKRPFLALAGVLWVGLAVAWDSSLPSDSWSVETGRGTVRLELVVDADGRLDGTLDGQRLNGAIVGSKLVFSTPEGVWVGWLTDGPHGPFLAGSVSGTDGVSSGWYARPEERTHAAEAPASAKDAATADPITTPNPTPRASRASGTPAPVSPVEGVWSDGDRQCTISADGHALTVRCDDGALYQGRITGPTALVAGLRKGCCSGALRGSNTIEWQDGGAWHRAD